MLTPAEIRQALALDPCCEESLLNFWAQSELGNLPEGEAPTVDRFAQDQAIGPVNQVTATLDDQIPVDLFTLVGGQVSRQNQRSAV